tara:strand:- start:150 stop:1130 length:981 start_codon:yes stop_codon:yes gene_type:complete
MDKTIKFLVERKNNNKRLDVFLSGKIHIITRSYIKKLIQGDNIQVNKVIVNTSSSKVRFKDEVLINIIEKKTPVFLPKKIELDIIFEDKDIAVINKPKGMVVHPGAGNYENTLVNALMYKYKNKLSNLNGKIRPGIVHRIDKDTSGIVVIAKNNLSHSNLAKQFNNHSIGRKYQCLTWGVIRPLNGKIETFITRNKKNRQLMTVSDLKGKKAITNYKTLKVFNCKDIPKISLIECELETGRTHQIRVHLKYKGSSIIGDQQYGKKNLKFRKINKDFFDILTNISGQILHAKSLDFSHPTKNKYLNFSVPLPKDFTRMLNLLNKLNS